MSIILRSIKLRVWLWWDSGYDQRMVNWLTGVGTVVRGGPWVSKQVLFSLVLLGSDDWWHVGACLSS